MNKRAVEIACLILTVVIAVSGSYIATVQAVASIDERSNANRRDIEIMQESWLSPRDVALRDAEVKKLLDDVSSIKESLATMSAKLDALVNRGR